MSAADNWVTVGAAKKKSRDGNKRHTNSGGWSDHARSLPSSAYQQPRSHPHPHLQSSKQVAASSIPPKPLTSPTPAFATPTAISPSNSQSPTSAAPATSTKLNGTWVLWFHSTSSTDWTLKGYEELYTFDTVEDFWILYNNLKLLDLTNGMYYLMRKGYPPMWDDAKNIGGGAWTFKIPKQNATPFWEEISYYCVGETICGEQSGNVVGVSISPKIRFVTIRVWTDTNSSDVHLFDTIAKETKASSVPINFEQARFTKNRDAAI